MQCGVSGKALAGRVGARASSHGLRHGPATERDELARQGGDSAQRVVEERQDRDARWERLLARYRDGDKLAREQLIAERLGLDLDDVVEALVAGRAYRATSMEERVGGETDDLTLADTLGEDDPEIHRRELLVALRQARHVLDDRERYVLHLRFAEDRTQTEIAEKIGVSQMQVSRILRGLLAKLRLELRRQGAELAA